MVMALEAGKARSTGLASIQLLPGGLALLPVGGGGGRGQMAVSRGEKMGRVDSIYNNALSMTNPAQRSEEVIIIPLNGCVSYFCVVVRRKSHKSSSKQGLLRLTV